MVALALCKISSNQNRTGPQEKYTPSNKMSESDGRVGVAGRADSAETHLNPVAGFIFAEVSGSVVREDGDGRERMVADVFEGRTSFHREIGQFGFGGERQVSDQNVIGLSNKQTGQSCLDNRWMFVYLFEP